MALIENVEASMVDKDECRLCLAKGLCGNANSLRHQTEFGGLGPKTAEEMIQEQIRLVKQEGCLHPEELQNAIDNMKQVFNIKTEFSPLIKR